MNERKTIFQYLNDFKWNLDGAGSRKRRTEFYSWCFEQGLFTAPKGENPIKYRHATDKAADLGYAEEVIVGQTFVEIYLPWYLEQVGCPYKPDPNLVEVWVSCSKLAKLLNSHPNSVKDSLKNLNIIKDNGEMTDHAVELGVAQYQVLHWNIWTEAGVLKLLAAFEQFSINNKEKEFVGSEAKQENKVL